MKWCFSFKALIGATLATFVSQALAGPIVLTIWLHAGPGPERDVVAASLRRFNASQGDIRVELQAVSEVEYPAQLETAARNKALPCVLDLDGPTVAYWASQNQLLPLDQLPGIAELRRKLLRTVVQQGTYQGKLYSMGQYDSGLSLWGNRRLLQKAGVRIPGSTRTPWSLEEFEAAMLALKKSGVPHPLDMKFNYGIGEWLTFSFSPIIQSFGGDLIDRRGTPPKASGTLNGPQAVRAMQTVQNWVRQGWVNAGTQGGEDFAAGRSALSYVGHWVYREYRKALGDDLVLIPMPRFGLKPVTGAGSWTWAVSSSCQHPLAAARVLQHLLSKEEVLQVTAANGAVPATLDAALASPEYGVNGPLRLYVDQILDGTARLRPETPAYPAVTKSFAAAVRAIVDGADPKTTLDRAATQIDAALAASSASP